MWALNEAQHFTSLEIYYTIKKPMDQRKSQIPHPLHFNGAKIKLVSLDSSEHQRLKSSHRTFFGHHGWRHDIVVVVVRVLRLS